MATELTEQHMRAVQSGTSPVDHKAAETARMRGPQQEETPPATGEEPVEEAAQPGQEAESQEGEQPSPEETQQQEQADSADRFMNALLERLETKQKAETQAAEEPQDIAQEQQIEKQKEEIQTEANVQLQALEQEKAALRKQIEAGELDPEKFAIENDRINEQRYSVREGMRDQVRTLDQELALLERDRQQSMRQHRESYAQNNPDFIQRYQSGEIQQAMQDPQVRSVLGNNPAAVNEYIKARALQQENETLKQQVANLQDKQQQAISKGAEDPGKHVAKQAGVNQHKPPAASSHKDGMMAALEAFRSQQGGLA